MTTCRAGAAAKNLPLYCYLAEIENRKLKIKNLPIPAFNVINGGVHAGNDLDFQEFMITPQAKNFSKKLEIASEIYHQLKIILESKFGKSATNLGDEGGFAPPIREPEEALNLILEAAEKSEYKNKIKIILDIAASQLYNNKQYQTKKKKLTFTRQGFLNYYQVLIKNYPIIGLEDPFAESDWQGFQNITEKFGRKISIIGDDLLVTNPKRISRAKEKNACNGLLVKINQIGTITETLEAVRLAKSFGWKIMVSHRSGETTDDFISDLAVGIDADFIKAGAPARGERVAKYNRLLRIEEELKL
jgi:enolase